MKLEFLDELTEARLYRNADTLKNKSAKDLAKITYLMILMLEVLRHRDGDFAEKYARDTLGYDNFTTLRSYATDLHNLLAVLSNQDEFEDKIKADSSISIPVLNVRRWLRDVANDSSDYYISRQLFVKLESTLKINDSSLKAFRRVAGNWHDSSTAERNQTAHRMSMTMQNYAQYSDISRRFAEKAQD